MYDAYSVKVSLESDLEFHDASVKYVEQLIETKNDD